MYQVSWMLSVNKDHKERENQGTRTWWKRYHISSSGQAHQGSPWGSCCIVDRDPAPLWICILLRCGSCYAEDHAMLLMLLRCRFCGDPTML